MKEKDVLVDFDAQQFVIYAEKSDGSFSPVQTGSYITKNYLDDFFNLNDRLYDSLLEKLKNGEISPIFFYMTIEDLTISELAARAGITKSGVRKHINPKGFQKATVSMLSKYAYVFNIPVANLFQVINTREDRSWNMGFREETVISESDQISQVITDNPLLVETKIVQTPR
jgi:transcriptional regulator with XRE-family HTH domain